MARKIYITGPDRLKLMKLIDGLGDDIKTKDYIRELYKDLMHADIVSAPKIPADTVRIYSQVLISLDGDTDEIRLAYPDEADALRNIISVFSPLGASVFGRREGGAFECSAINVKNAVIEGVYNGRTGA